MTSSGEVGDFCGCAGPPAFPSGPAFAAPFPAPRGAAACWTSPSRRTQYPISPVNPERAMKGSVGSPGMIASANRKVDAIKRGLG